MRLRFLALSVCFWLVDGSSKSESLPKAPFYSFQNLKRFFSAYSSDQELHELVELYSVDSYNAQISTFLIVVSSEKELPTKDIRRMGPSRGCVKFSKPVSDYLNFRKSIPEEQRVPERALKKAFEDLGAEIDDKVRLFFASRFPWRESISPPNSESVFIKTDTCDEVLFFIRKVTSEIRFEVFDHGASTCKHAVQFLFADAQEWSIGYEGTCKRSEDEYLILLSKDNDDKDDDSVKYAFIYWHVPTEKTYMTPFTLNSTPSCQLRPDYLVLQEGCRKLSFFRFSGVGSGFAVSRMENIMNSKEIDSIGFSDNGIGLVTYGFFMGLLSYSSTELKLISLFTKDRHDIIEHSASWLYCRCGFYKNGIHHFLLHSSYGYLLLKMGPNELSISLLKLYGHFRLSYVEYFPSIDMLFMGANIGQHKVTLMYGYSDLEKLQQSVPVPISFRYLPYELCNYRPDIETFLGDYCDKGESFDEIYGCLRLEWKLNIEDFHTQLVEKGALPFPLEGKLGILANRYMQEYAESEELAFDVAVLLPEIYQDHDIPNKLEFLESLIEPALIANEHVAVYFDGKVSILVYGSEQATLPDYAAYVFLCLDIVLTVRSNQHGFVVTPICCHSSGDISCGVACEDCKRLHPLQVNVATPYLVLSAFVSHDKVYVVYRTLHKVHVSSSEGTFPLCSGNQALYHKDILYIPSDNTVSLYECPFHTCLYAKASISERILVSDGIVLLDNRFYSLSQIQEFCYFQHCTLESPFYFDSACLISYSDGCIVAMDNSMDRLWEMQIRLVEPFLLIKTGIVRHTDGNLQFIPYEALRGL